MYCENCGAKIDDDSKFCEHCGAQVEADPADSAPEPVMDLEDLMSLGAEEQNTESADKTMVFRKPPGRAAAAEEPREQETAPAARAAAAGEPENLEFSPSAPEDEADPSAPDPDLLSGLELPLDREEASGFTSSEQEPEEKQEFAEFQEEEELSEAADGWPVWPDPRETEKDEWLQAEIARTMESLQKSSNDFFYEDLTEYEEDVEAPEEMEEIHGRQEEKETQAISYPPPETMENYVQQHFCMACGQILPAGAAFCSACGTPTGEVAPTEPVKDKLEGGMALKLLKNLFTSPAETIQSAASDKALLSGIGFFVLKDVLLAVLAAILAGRLSVAAGTVVSWFAGGDPFGFGAKVFLCSIFLDVLWIAAVLGAGKLFRAELSFRAIIGSCGTAGLFTSGLLLITLLLAAVLPGAAGCAGIVTVTVTALAMEKAVSAAIKLKEDWRLFLLAAAAACYIIVLCLLIHIF